MPTVRRLERSVEPPADAVHHVMSEVLGTEAIADIQEQPVCDEGLEGENGIYSLKGIRCTGDKATDTGAYSEYRHSDISS